MGNVYTFIVQQIQLRERLSEANAAIRLLKRESRLKDFTSAEGKHIPLTVTRLSGRNSGNSHSGSSKPFPNIEGQVDYDDCLTGLPHQDQVESICNLVLSNSDSLMGEEEPLADEREFWHPRISKIISAIRLAASTLHVPTLNPLYETLASDGGSNKGYKPDYVFTLPHEKRRFHGNTCTFLEVKSTERQNMSIGQLVREGIAQTLKYLGVRQDKCSDLPTLGIGCVAIGTKYLLIVRVDFSDDEMPVKVSKELQLWPSSPVVPTATQRHSARAGGRRTDRVAITDHRPVPEGLRVLVRLMLTTNAELFGLAPVMFEPESPLRCCRMLGEGGFANVEAVVEMEGEEVISDEIACKWLRHNDRSLLDFECTVLNELSNEGVNYIPKVCTTYGKEGIVKSITKDNVPPRYGLLLSPVGEPCKPDPTGEFSDVVKFACKVFVHMWHALTAAHNAGYAHCDVRPSNLIKVTHGAEADADAGTQVLLIDWGLAKKIGDRYSMSELKGVRAFFSRRLLSECTTFERLSSHDRKNWTWTPEPNDDLEAAALTFAAFVCADDPFAIGLDWLATANDVLTERDSWLQRHGKRLLNAAAHIEEIDIKTELLKHLSFSRRRSRTQTETQSEYSRKRRKGQK